MIYAVFLCDTEWKINKIRQCNTELLLQEEMFLTEVVLERQELQNTTENHFSLELTFLGQKVTIPAVIDSFKEGNLVILVQVRNNQDFIELHNEYPVYLEWAKNHLLGLYHNEYFMIQQINNQLVDAQRRLARSNRQLEEALDMNKEINEKLEKAKTFAEQANASKTKFLANMSHDIRTPMNAIVGLAELIQHHLGEPDILKRYVSKLKSSSKYLLDLINDILDLSKIENGSMELRIEPMDIWAQIEQTVMIIRSEAEKKNQKLLVKNDGIEFGYMMGDPVRFRQILMNLFSNAVKYTPEGGKIQFTVQELERNEFRYKYQFIIEDNGIGMTSEFAEHIFEPFSRAVSAVGKIQGTGLGMAITKNIVDAMGGTIRVESTLGKGSRFYIELSFAACSEEPAPNPETQSQKYAEQENAGQGNAAKEEIDNLNGMRFLCAEDNELNAEILTAVLEMEGAECVVYKNGQLLTEAFEKTEPGDYDAILMDVQMPVMNGYEATRAIRNSKNPLGKKIPIIAMTANAFAEDIERCMEAGMNAHLAKPIQIDEVIKIISYYCSKR